MSLKGIPKAVGGQSTLPEGSDCYDVDGVSHSFTRYL